MYLRDSSTSPTSSSVRRKYYSTLDLNQALEPLVDNPEQHSVDTTVIFLNEVAICIDDILELIHQCEYQSADMACAVDWTYVRADPTFYDTWIARRLNGGFFFNIPQDGNWDSAWNLFWNNPKAAERLQVFSYWNGTTAFTAKPFLEQKIRFRSPFNTECAHGEPKLFTKDKWYHDYGKIAVVPDVKLEYTNEAAKDIKSAKGYVSQWTERESRNACLLIRIRRGRARMRDLRKGNYASTRITFGRNHIIGRLRQC